MNSSQCRDPTIHEWTPVRSDRYRKQGGTKSRAEFTDFNTQVIYTFEGLDNISDLNDEQH